VKIVSYSLYGNQFRYTEPLILNAKYAKEFYPDWILRVYHDQTVSNDVLSILRNFNVQLINIENLPSTYLHLAPKFWRFLPILEENINAVIFRDADSLFTIREVKLVNKWLTSNKNFHIIRDHQLHISPILAGMFGIKKGGFNIFKNQLFNNPKIINKNTYNSDQIFLADHLYAQIINSTLVHTSYFAFKGEKFERIDKCLIANSFIGAIYTDKASDNGPLLIEYDFIIGIPFWLAKLLRYRIRPVLYLSYFFYTVLNKFKG